MQAMCVAVWCTEPDYAFEKELNDADAYEKETAEFECEVNDEEAAVQWFREDKVSHKLLYVSDHIFLAFCLGLLMREFHYFDLLYRLLYGMLCNKSATFLKWSLGLSPLWFLR